MRWIFFFLRVLSLLDKHNVDINFYKLVKGGLVKTLLGHDQRSKWMLPLSGHIDLDDKEQET